MRSTSAFLVRSTGRPSLSTPRALNFTLTFSALSLAISATAVFAPRASQSQCDGAADAAAPPGYQCCFSLEFHHATLASSTEFVFSVVASFFEAAEREQRRTQSADKFGLFADVDLSFECLLQRLDHAFLTSHAADEGDLVFHAQRA